MTNPQLAPWHLLTAALGGVLIASAIVVAVMLLTTRITRHRGPVLDAETINRFVEASLRVAEAFRLFGETVAELGPIFERFAAALADPPLEVEEVPSALFVYCGQPAPFGLAPEGDAPWSCIMIAGHGATHAFGVPIPGFPAKLPRGGP